MKKNKWILWLFLLMFVFPAISCKLPFSKKTQEAESVLLPGHAIYNNGIVEIMLPETYSLRDIREDIPLISKALAFFGETNLGINIEDLVDELLKGTVMWAVDGDINYTDSQKMLIIKNKVMANIPLGLIGSTIETLFKIPEEQFDTEILRLGKHDVVRLTLSQSKSSQAIYALKDQSLMWIIIFVTTPDQMPAQLTGFENCVATFKVISIPLEE